MTIWSMREEIWWLYPIGNMWSVVNTHEKNNVNGLVYYLHTTFQAQWAFVSKDFSTEVINHIYAITQNSNLS